MTRSSPAVPDDGPAGAARRSPATLAALGVAAALVCAGLVALGVWQVHRLAWKEALLARVERNAHASPVDAPGPAAWPAVGQDDAYRRVSATGEFLNDRETPVQALTERGGGFWILTPLRRGDGSIVLVNRGFVPADRLDPATRIAGQLSGPGRIDGLLRLTEPGGSFLRRNDPTANRWYSRDVDAIAAADRLGPTAPFFIDADGTSNPGGLPVGGLTVLAFPNNHLVYALTWFTLAALLAGAVGWVIWTEGRHPRTTRAFHKQGLTRHPRDQAEVSTGYSGVMCARTANRRRRSGRAAP